MPSSRSPPARSAVRTSICSTASCPRWKRATSSVMRPWARSSRWDRKQEAQGRRSRGGSIHDLLRRMLLLQEGLLLGLRALKPQSQDGREALGPFPAGLFGYSHMLGGYAGGQAEYLRVPYADVGLIKVPQGLGDEQVLFLFNMFPTGFMAADFCNLKAAKPSRSGGAVPSASSRSRARSCWVQNGSSPSRPFRSILPLPRHPGL